MAQESCARTPTAAALSEGEALAGGQVPDLRPVGIEVDHEEKSVTALTAGTGELAELWMRDQA